MTTIIILKILGIILIHFISWQVFTFAMLLLSTAISCFIYWSKMPWYDLSWTDVRYSTVTGFLISFVTCVPHIALFLTNHEIV